MKLARVLGLIGVGILSLALLSGCSIILNPISEEERYQYVNAVKDSLDYRKAGEVVKEGYDENDQYFGPSVFYADVKGDETFGV